MRSLVAAALLASLVLVSTASAKELESVAVCGAGGCRTVRDGELLHGAVPEGDPAAAPSAAAPFLRVAMRFASEEEAVTVRSVLVPSTGMLGSQDGWVLLPPDARGAFGRLADGLDPLPAARLAAALGELGATPIQPRRSDAPVSAPPVDRTSDTGVVLAMGAVVVLLGLLAAGMSLRRRHHGAHGPLTG